MRVLAGLGLTGIAFTVSSEASKPNILLVLVDDWGWNDVGYHRKRLTGNEHFDSEINTPNIDNLVKAGIELDRHYTYNYCSPTRSALQSGRLPVHVSVENTDPISVNPEDPVSGYSGIPTKMTGIAEKLRKAGYRTHMTGKWDAGMAAYEQTPMGKGYETFFGYYHHANSMLTQKLDAGSTVHTDLCQKNGQELVDLWDTAGPAFRMNGTKWEEYMFTENSLRVIEEHDASNEEEPLFLFHSFRSIHTPLQPPKEHENRYSFINDQDRRKYASMVEYMDASLGEMVAALQRKGMWENTLMIVSSDNGGPIYGSMVSPTPPHLKRAFGAATNLPLRGGKTSDWEGGIRVNAFVSGGAVPLKMRGTKMHNIFHISDWYTTLCSVAGVDAHDQRAEAFNLPAVDGVNQWPVLSGQVPQEKVSTRELHVSRKTLIQGRWKLMTGNDRAIFKTFPENYTTFDVHGNGYGMEAVRNTLTRGRYCGDGCLFDIFEDPNEDHEVSKDHPEVVAKMMARLAELNKSNFNPDRGQPSAAACKVAMERYGGFYGPFVDVDGSGKVLNKQELSKKFFDVAELSEEYLVFSS